jgi:hypothetical protein
VVENIAGRVQGDDLASRTEPGVNRQHRPGTERRCQKGLPQRRRKNDCRLFFGEIPEFPLESVFKGRSEEPLPRLPGDPLSKLVPLLVWSCGAVALAVTREGDEAGPYDSERRRLGGPKGHRQLPALLSPEDRQEAVGTSAPGGLFPVEVVPEGRGVRLTHSAGPGGPQRSLPLKDPEELTPEVRIGGESCREDICNPVSRGIERKTLRRVLSDYPVRREIRVSQNLRRGGGETGFMRLVCAGCTPRAVG